MSQNAASSLSESLQSLLNNHPEGEDIRVSTLFKQVGDKGFGMLLMLLSLPSALPIPAPGYSIPFGILLILLGTQMIRGHDRPTLLKRAETVVLPRKLTRLMLASAKRFFHSIEWFIQPRLKWVRTRTGRLLMGVLVCAMAALMLIPIPGTNTAPAMVIFLIGVGLSEDDGVFAVLACFGAILATLFYYGLVVAMAYYGPGVFTEAFDAIKEFLKGLVGT